jgi:hypothetical protein
MNGRFKLASTLVFVVAFLHTQAVGAEVTTKKPNILVIWGDDIG